MPVEVKNVVVGVSAVVAGVQLDALLLGMFFAVLLVDTQADEDCIASLTGVHGEG